MTSLARQFKSAKLAWSAASAAHEIDALMRRLPTSILEALLLVEQPRDRLAMVSSPRRRRGSRA